MGRWSSVVRVADPAQRKAEIRRARREWRRSLTAAEIDVRSERIWVNLATDPEIGEALERAHVVMVYTPIHGEPTLAALREWCGVTGIRTVTPESDPDPSGVDVVIVPGVAFTAAGDRLGQGGGWYDRFLARVRPDAVTVGVCFTEQVLDGLPVEEHDIALDRVVTDADPGDRRPDQLSS